MSLSFLYRRIPSKDRVCSRCQRPILHNITQDGKGRLYHYGCLQTALDEKHSCWNCGMNFDGTEASVDFVSVFFQGEYRQERQVQCPSCGAKVKKRRRNLAQ